ncbi:MAG: DUF3883 domain-containing protein, partial [Sphaerospermopsis kisseleviana]
IGETEQTLIEEMLEGKLESSWLLNDLEGKATDYAISQIVPQHLQEVKVHKQELIDKTMAAVKDRLIKEINYWDYRATDLEMQEQAGKINAKINSTKARNRADELQARLQKRLEELQQERRLSPLPPIVIGGALIVPIGLLQRLQGISNSEIQTFAKERKRIEQIAMLAVMENERQLGYEPRDVSDEKCGYDIESKMPETGKLRFIEVKGRVAGATTVTVTKNEIITALNKPDNFILALVQVDGNNPTIYYVQKPFSREPDFRVNSVNYNWHELIDN